MAIRDTDASNFMRIEEHEGGGVSMPAAPAFPTGVKQPRFLFV
jgi:hypothetical protein